MINFGYTPSNNDFGDLTIKEFAGNHLLQAVASQNISDCYIIPSNKVPTKNQGQLSACAAFSTTTCLEILHANRPDAKFEPLSPLFVYYNARMLSNDTGADQGSFIHNNFYSLKTLGVSEYNLWPTHPNEVLNKPAILAYKEANDNTISDFHQITNWNQQKLQDIELSIRANLPVVFGTAISNDFINYGGEDKVFNPPSNADIAGYHAMIIIGVRNNNSKKEFCLLNSWGSWGQQIDGKFGFVWISSDYIINPNSADFFVAESFPNLLI